MYIKVKVTPEAKKESVEWKTDDTVILSIREKAQNGAANKKIIEVLINEYKAKGKKVSVKLVSGHQSPSKIFSITHYENNKDNF